MYAPADMGASPPHVNPHTHPPLAFRPPPPSCLPSPPSLSPRHLLYLALSPPTQPSSRAAVGRMYVCGDTAEPFVPLPGALWLPWAADGVDGLQALLARLAAGAPDTAGTVGPSCCSAAVAAIVDGAVRGLLGDGGAGQGGGGLIDTG
jgi:hypothetical protein